MKKTAFRPLNIHELFEKIGRPKESKGGRVCGLCGQFELDDEYAVIAIPSVGRICSYCHRTLEKEVLFIEKLQDMRLDALKNVFTSDQDDFIMVSDE
jgi:hypothetical protein